MQTSTLRKPIQSRLSRLLKSHFCKDCLLTKTTRRSISNPSTLPPAPPPTGFARLTNRALILVHGRDAAHYLQGLTTSNIRDYPLHSTSACFTAFLNAQGRVLHDVFIYPIHHAPNIKTISHDEPGYMIDVDEDSAASLRSHLKRFKLRAKVEIHLSEPGEWHLYATWDDTLNNNNNNNNTTTIPPPSQPPHSHQQTFSYLDPRAPTMGSRILTTTTPSTNPTLPGPETSTQTYDIRRILTGVPQGPAEILPAEALPLESNIDYMSGIDFRKGCYLGQELTIRTHHTGVVRKRILPVQLYGVDDDDDEPPATLKYDDESSIVGPDAGQNIARVNNKGRSAGKFLRGVGNVGLALCRLETMTDVRVTMEEGGGGAGLWSPEQEFKMAWNEEGGNDDGEQKGEREVKIKAFVPEWHRGRTRSVRDIHHQQQNAQNVVS
ncbi:MAG: hypothetical protein Q9182_006435 [Xanthomendoza sp. 2 TL-2023]